MNELMMLAIITKYSDTKYSDTDAIIIILVWLVSLFVGGKALDMLMYRDK